MSGYIRSMSTDIRPMSPYIGPMLPTLNRCHLTSVQCQLASTAVGLHRTAVTLHRTDVSLPSPLSLCNASLHGSRSPLLRVAEQGRRPRPFFAAAGLAWRFSSSARSAFNTRRAGRSPRPRRLRGRGARRLSSGCHRAEPECRSSRRRRARRGRSLRGAAAALRCAGRGRRPVPRDVKVEEVGAVALKVHPFAAASRIRTGCSSGGRVESARDLFRLSSDRPSWNWENAAVAVSRRRKRSLGQLPDSASVRRDPHEIRIGRDVDVGDADQRKT